MKPIFSCVFIFLILFNACKKDNTITASGDNCLIIAIAGGADTTYSTFTYNSAGKITEIINYTGNIKDHYVQYSYPTKDTVVVVELDVFKSPVGLPFKYVIGTNNYAQKRFHVNKVGNSTSYDTIYYSYNPQNYLVSTTQRTVTVNPPAQNIINTTVTKYQMAGENLASKLSVTSYNSNTNKDSALYFYSYYTDKIDRIGLYDLNGIVNITGKANKNYTFGDSVSVIYSTGGHFSNHTAYSYLFDGKGNASRRIITNSKGKQIQQRIDYQCK